MIRNLRTGYISPQFHVVYDDWFETVTSSEAEEPPEWEQMLIYQRYQTEFEPGVDPPPLSPDWLTPEELHQRRQSPIPKQGRVTYQEAHSQDVKEDREFSVPRRHQNNIEKVSFPEIPLFDSTQPSTPREPSSTTREPSIPRELTPTPPVPAQQSKPKPEDYWKPAATKRQRKPVQRYDPSSTKRASYASAIAFALMSSVSAVPPHVPTPFAYMTAKLTDPVSGVIDDLHPGIMHQYPQALKAKKILRGYKTFK